MKVLVAYASRHGATAGIAKRIAERMKASGVDAVAEEVTGLRDVSAYDAYVVGSAAYMFRWLKEATRFVKRNARTLEERPLWLFSSGPTGTDLVDEKGRDIFEAMRPKEFETFRNLAPIDTKVFFGAWKGNEEPKGAAERFLNLMPESWKEDIPVGDFRDWDAIDAWADEIAAYLTGPTA
ncbi:MAG: flavodoxin domain-containing protein [Acidimicrobiia bacterium]|nr:flavodoxin domain-containing protein [Acidimicrobiia bacterium]